MDMFSIAEVKVTQGHWKWHCIDELIDYIFSFFDLCTFYIVSET